VTPPAPVRILQLGLWIAVAAGPVLGVAALVVASSAGRQQPPPAVPGVGVTSIAEVAVLQHVLGGAVPPDRLQPVRQQLQPVPDVTVALPALAGPGPVDVAAVTATPAGPDRWGVTVLVLGRDATIEAWQVTVVETAGGPAVEGLPALVPTPRAEAPAALALDAPRTPAPDDVLAATVEGFLRAVLLGTGEVDRWTAVDVDVPALDHPVAEMTLRRIARDRVSTTSVAVLAEVELRRADGSALIAQYPLLLAEREGRIEVARVLPALPLAPTGP